VLNTRCPIQVISDKFKKLEANLFKNGITAELRGKFIDYASKLPDAELDDFLKIFDDTSENAIRAWEKLSELVTDKKLWVSKNEALLRKLDADPAKIDKVKDYYNSHTFPEDRPAGNEFAVSNYCKNELKNNITRLF
jgi:arsenate reductase-like glutaredoxin family protein